MIILWGNFEILTVFFHFAWSMMANFLIPLEISSYWINEEHKYYWMIFKFIYHLSNHELEDSVWSLNLSFTKQLSEKKLSLKIKKLWKISPIKWWLLWNKCVIGIIIRKMNHWWLSVDRWPAYPWRHSWRHQSPEPLQSWFPESTRMIICLNYSQNY